MQMQVWEYTARPGSSANVLTTKRMITTAIDQRRYNKPYHPADATHNFTLEGHPILMIGSVNWKRQFLATAVMMSTEQKDFALIKETVRVHMRKLFPRLHEVGALSYAVSYMLADSAGAIKNGEALVSGLL
ncbi:predicted protein, partial [Micromonas commoda]